MTLHFSLGLDSVLLRGRPEWLPAALFGGGTGGAWHDPGRGLFQDVAGTVPVTAPGQTVALMRDLSGNGRHATQATAAARPVFGRHPPRGRVNRLPNNGTGGAVPGVLGSGGALPAGWDLTGTPGAFTAEVVAITADHIDLAVENTSGAGTFFLRLPSQSGGFLPTAQNDNWAFSLGLALVAGSIADAVVALGGTQRDGAGVSLGSMSFATPAPTGTLTRFGGTAQITNASAVLMNADLRVTATAPFTATFRISRPQLERGTEVTALQATSASGFDVTEAGQRDVYYLKPDGVDDFMVLAANFEPAGSYTYAIAVNHTSGDSDPHLGSTGGLVRFGPGAGVSFAMWANGTANRTLGASQSYGRQVYVGCWSGSGAASIWRGGNLMGLTLEGAMSPLAAGGVNRLFAAGSVFAKGLFYGGMMIDRAITEAERQMLQPYLASKGGIAL